MEKDDLPTNMTLEQSDQVPDLDSLQVRSSDTNETYNGHELMTDASGRLFYWIVAPGQEHLPPDETQEVIAVYPFEEYYR